MSGKHQPKKLPKRKFVKLPNESNGRFVVRNVFGGGMGHMGGDLSNSGGIMGGGQQHFIVTLFQNLKRVAEAVLRWAFFTLNLFMLALYICQN